MKSGANNLQATPLFVIDVAHPPRHPDDVEAELRAAWQTVRNSPTFSVLKVIHGHGSSGKGGSTREVVRNWLFRMRHHFQWILTGEEYTFFDPRVQELRQDIGQFADPDLGAGNRGITVVRVR